MKTSEELDSRSEHAPPCHAKFFQLGEDGGGHRGRGRPRRQNTFEWLSFTVDPVRPSYGARQGVTKTDGCRGGEAGGGRGPEK